MNNVYIFDFPLNLQNAHYQIEMNYGVQIMVHFLGLIKI